jgi:hypothetical protein
MILANFLRHVASILVCLLGLAASAQPREYIPATNAITREIHPKVDIVRGGHGRKIPVSQGETIQGEDLLETGALGSAAQIELNNGTLWQFGSETAFTFSAKTNLISLTKGLSLVCVREGDQLFCQTCALLARIQSTAIIEQFSASEHNGKTNECATKFILLEGHVELTKGKKTKFLSAGQMIIQYASDPDFAPIWEVDVKKLLKESRVITGFRIPLPSMVKIQAVIDQQQKDLARGVLEPSPSAIGGRGPERYHQPAAANYEAPFDPDTFRAIVIRCPTCD